MKYLTLIIGLLWALGASGQIYIDSYRFAAAPAANLLLDDYPNAAGAYSLRKLRNAYTGDCIVVRRSSNNDTLAIGFSGNYLDTAALKTFCASTDCFVRTWYDQSMNVENFVQTTDNTRQPKIVTGGVLEKEGDIVAIKFDGTNDVLENSLQNDLSAASAHAIFMALKIGRIAASNYVINIAASTTDRIGFSGRMRYTLTTSTSVGVSFIGTAGNEYLVVMLNSPQNLYFNNTLATGRLIELPASNVAASIGARVDGAVASLISAYEVIFYATDQSSNRTSIQSNINSFYNIY